MADLGTISVAVIEDNYLFSFQPKLKVVDSFDFLESNTIKFDEFQETKQLSGLVKVNNANSARIVRVHDRNTGFVVANITSAEDGTFNLNNYDDITKYYIVALPLLEDDANAVIVDRITGG
jgi:hypothetical protein